MIPTITKLIDSNGTPFGIDRIGNSPIVITNSLGMAISAGNSPDSVIVHKFGNIEDFDTTDGITAIWDGADDADIAEMQYTYSTTPAIDTISSSNAGDTQVIEVHGLDANWNLTVQNVTLEGQTQVTLVTPLIRAFRLKNEGVTDNAGHIYVFEQTADAGGDGVPDDTTKIRALIHPSNNQTLMALYTIPNGKTGFMLSFYGAVSGAKKTASYNISLLARPFGKVFQLKHLSSLIEEGTSHWNHQFQVPQRYPERTDIEMRAQINTAAVTGASVSAGFDIVLLDN